MSGREAARSERIGERVVGVRVDGVGRAGAAHLDHDPVEPADHRSLALVDRGEVEARGTGVDDRSGQPRPGRIEHLGRRDPVTHGGFDRLAGQQFELAHVDPAALGDHALHRSIGRRPRRLRDGRDVEHLATADRLVASRLTQYVSVAGEHRKSDGQEESHCASGSRSERVGSQHPDGHGQLARPDVREVRASPRHLVVEGREHVERRVEAIGRPPPTRGDHGVAAAQLVVTDPAEVERDPVARPDRVERRAQRLDRPHAGGRRAGLDQLLQESGFFSTETVNVKGQLDPPDRPDHTIAVPDVGFEG